MKRKRAFTFFSISSVVLLFGMNSPQYPTGPHNGHIQKTGNYYIEMKNSEQEIHAYLLDIKMVPLSNKGITCETKLIFADSSVLIKHLKPFGNDGFSVGIPPIPYNYCRISFTVAGKIVSAGFENRSLIVEKNR